MLCYFSRNLYIPNILLSVRIHKTDYFVTFVSPQYGSTHLSFRQSDKQKGLEDKRHQHLSDGRGGQSSVLLQHLPQVSTAEEPLVLVRNALADIESQCVKSG